MGVHKLSIIIFLLLLSFSSINAQPYKDILLEIDSALQSYDNQKAYDLIYQHYDEIQDSTSLLEFKLRELHVLEHMEMYGEAIELSNSLITWPDISPKHLVDVELDRALVYEILNDLEKTRNSLDIAKSLVEEELYSTNSKLNLIGRYFIRESSYYINLFRSTEANADYEKYKLFTQKAIDFSLRNNYPDISATAFMLLSFNPRLGNREKQIYMNISLHWWKKTGDIHGVSAMYNNLAMLNFDEISRAKRYNDSAFLILRGKNIPFLQAYSHETRYRLFDQMGKADSALAHYIRYKELYDEYDYRRKVISVKRIDRKAFVEKEKLKNHLLQDTIIKEQQNNEILVIVAIVLILFSLLLIYLYLQLSERRKEIVRSRKKLSHNLEEKTLLLAELNHRVKNNLSLILSLMQLQRNQNKHKEEDWNQLESRINTMAMAHSLYTYSNENISGSTIDLKSYLKNIVKSYEDIEERPLKFNVEVNSSNVSVENALPIGIIFNELVSNSIKHAKIEDDVLEIKFEVDLSDEIFKLVYQDNGVKFIDSEKPSTGLFILNALTKQLNGSIHRKGSYYEITLYKK